MMVNYHIGCFVLGLLCVGVSGNPDTTPAETHPYSNTQQTKNETANLVVQEHSRILLKMGILMPEAC